MDFVRLGPLGDTSYRPDVLIKNYSSLIWTERWVGHGEFELKTSDVADVRALLREGTFVSHLETRTVMQVETVEVAVVGDGMDAQPELTIRGREASVILENRHVQSTGKTKRKMRLPYTATEAAAVLLYNSVCNLSGVDVTRGDNKPSTPNIRNNYSWNTRDALPNVVVTESVASEGGSRHWFVEFTDTYSILQKILRKGNLGLRVLRPVTPTAGVVITVETALATRGTVYREAQADISHLMFNLYSPTDRSQTVVFNDALGHLVSPQYLWSNRDEKTTAVLKADHVPPSVWVVPGMTHQTGWNRKMVVFDGGSPEIPDEPDEPERPKKNASAEEKDDYEDAMDEWVDAHRAWRTERAEIIADFQADANEEAINQLKKQKKTRLLSADISEASPYRYKTHYNLGDTVSLRGNYGFVEKVVVGEYIRTDDANGDRGFPGFTTPDPQ